MRFIVLVCAAVVVAALSPGAADPAFAQAATPSAVFDKKEVSWRSIKDRSKSEFKSKLASFKNNGFIPVDIDLEDSDEGFMGGATVQTNTDNRGWDVRLDLSPGDFTSTVNLMRTKGYRLVDQDHYTRAGKRVFGGLFIRNVENLAWDAARDLTMSQALELIDKVKNKMMPIDVDLYKGARGMAYALVFVDNAEGLSWEIELFMQGDTKFEELGEQHGAAHRMVAFDALAHYPLIMTYAAVWVENVSGQGWWMNWDNQRKKDENRWYRLADEGYRLIGYDRYRSWSGTRYAGIWRQNSTRPNWKHREDVDKLLSDVRKETDVPGIGAAVIQDGEMKYLRGEGYAHMDPDKDPEDWTWLDSQHVIRTASVAKAVAGTIYMQLKQDGTITGDEDTKDLIPGMPGHHTHKLWQLVSNRGCIPHTGELSDQGFKDGYYTTATGAAMQFWDDPLLDDCDPTDISADPGYVDHYSTPSYTLAGSVFEYADGKPINEIITDRITKAHDLSTLRSLDMEDTSVRRSSMWKADGEGDDLENKPLDQYESSWKVLGGGMESSLLDLVRFGHKLVSGQILDAAHLNEMWTVPDSATDDDTGDASNYAYGWSIGTESGHAVASKTGKQAGARTYIRIYPDDNVVIAVMSNREDGGHDTKEVGKTIGAKIIADIP